MSETNRIEYKLELSKDLDIEKEVIAFLNYHKGGIIYIGIDKDGSVIGVEDVDSDMLKIKDRLKNNIQPSCLGLFDVRSEKSGEKYLIKVIIASGPEKPYFKRKYGITEKGTKYPICMEGKHACPPEDCGGVDGYYNVIEVLSDPDHDYYEDMRTWAGKDWDPKRFEPDKVRFDNPYKRWRHAFLSRK